MFCVSFVFCEFDNDLRSLWTQKKKTKNYTLNARFLCIIDDSITKVYYKFYKSDFQTQIKGVEEESLAAVAWFDMQQK